MKKVRLTCPVCHQELDLGADEYECVQVSARCCRVVDVKSLRGDTGGIVCFVHQDHFGELVKMVRAGAYPRHEQSV